MITIEGTIHRTRKATFKDGRQVTFLEALIEHTDRSEIIEILLNADMNTTEFVKGSVFKMAVSYYAKGDRLYCSATRTQPPGFPEIQAA